MGKLGLSLALAVLLLTGCTRIVGDARPQMERPVAPIPVGQVDDLLSQNANPDEFPSPYVTVEPDECAALAQEARAPLIFDAKPAAHSGGYWFDDGAPTANVMEIVGVYHSDFDSVAALDKARRIIESCRDDRLKASGADGEAPDVFRVVPGQDSGSPQIALWSLSVVGEWFCNNAFVASHNAAIELTTCSEADGYDVLALAKDALKRIEALVNKTS
jgi:hypothetical protein